MEKENDMQFTMSALLKAVPDLEAQAFSKDVNDDKRRAAIVMWSLANEIDTGMKTLHEAATSLTRRFQMYTEALTEGRLSGLDLPARSSYFIDIIELQNKIIAQRQSLTTLISLTCGNSHRKVFETELPQA